MNRLHTITLAVLLFLSCLVYSLRAQTDNARIVIDTDCTTSNVQTYGGDLGYPGPSQVVCEYDGYGAVLHVDIRVFDTRRSFIYLPMVNQ